MSKRALKEVHHATEIINKDIKFSSQSIRKTKARGGCLRLSLNLVKCPPDYFIVNLTDDLVKSSLCNSHHFYRGRPENVCLRGLTTMKLPTDKLRQVIRLIHDESNTNRVIGITAGVSPNTVKNVRDLLRFNHKNWDDLKALDNE